jgi:lipid-binding SYLF domain-containing protein
MNIHIRKRSFLLAGASLAALTALSACTTTGSGSGDPEAQRKALDAAADNALSRLYAQQPGSKELVGSARGVLVFPSFGSAGFLVGGGTGTGVLRTGDKTASYHRMTEASVGLLAGAQSQAVFILFMTAEALKRFQDSRGWTVGADANVAMISVGANAQVTSQTARQDVIGFVMTNRGLMGNLSLNGNRVTRLDL